MEQYPSERIAKLEQAFDDFKNHIISYFSDIKLQQGRLEERIESEERTRAVQKKEMIESIEKFKKEYFDFLINPVTGVLIKVDRLEIESTQRKKMQDRHYALLISLTAVVVTFMLWVGYYLITGSIK